MTRRTLVGLAVVTGCLATLLLALPAEAPATVNCSDFSTQAGAQNYYESVGGPGQDPEGLDADHDGIACETLPCPCRSLSPDTDGDGWVDQYDACPTVAARTTNGCPLPPPPPPPPSDTDHDGVVDTADACPTVAATTPNGCPVPPPPSLKVYAGRFDLGDGDYSPLGTPQHKPPRVWPFSADARTSVVGIRWRRWGESEAIGAGTTRVNDCRPTCGKGHIVRYPGAHVVLSRRLQGDCRGQAATFYTRARFSWRGTSGLRRVTAKLVAGCGQS
jgi:excalibur calcium-binding domain-containing protein/thrombospondin type 3 repeat protein